MAILGGALAASSVSPVPLQGQDADPDAGGWNSPRALDLVQRAVARRSAGLWENGLSSYRSLAEGHVYFFVELREEGERTLVRADQVAVEVYWSAPDLVMQRIVGMRDESRLPNRMHYHLDHLVVVHDNFGEVIRLGDGDEVRDVPHPASHTGLGIYDYRLADSLTLRLPGAPEPVRVYRVDVRPREQRRPGFVGAVYLDRSTAQIARMDFTFTAASYVDRRLESITVSLENGLWEGRFWLPHEQRLEIRRQLPELDLPALTVIEGGFRIGDYRFDEPVLLTAFRPGTIVAAPPEQRRAYPFASGLYDRLDELGGRGATRDLAEVRSVSARLAAGARMSALPRLRPYLPGASGVARYNRAEGLFLGGGMAYGAAAAPRATLTAGYAAGARRLSVESAGRFDIGGTAVELRARANGLEELGPWSATPGALNSLVALLGGPDHLDAYRAHGFRLGIQRRIAPEWRVSGMAALESHRSADLVVTEPPLGSGPPRAVRAVDEGLLTAGKAALRRTATADARAAWSGALALEAGSFEGSGYVRPWAELELARRTGDRRGEAILRAEGGAAFGDVPVQRLFLIGGAAGLPGYEHRALGGTRAGRLALEAAHEVGGPWVRLRGLAAVAWTGGDPGTLPGGWPDELGAGFRPTLGAGLGLGYDLLRVDVARGLRGGRWQAVISVNPRIRDLL